MKVSLLPRKIGVYLLNKLGSKMAQALWPRVFGFYQNEEGIISGGGGASSLPKKAGENITPGGGKPFTRGGGRFTPNLGPPFGGGKLSFKTL